CATRVYRSRLDAFGVHKPLLPDSVTTRSRCTPRRARERGSASHSASFLCLSTRVRRATVDPRSVGTAENPNLRPSFRPDRTFGVFHGRGGGRVATMAT